MEEKIIIVPKARPAVNFGSNLLVIPKDDVDKYVKEIDKHHVDLIRSIESSWKIMADGMSVRTAKMVKEKYEEIIADKDKTIAELNEERRWRKFPDEKPTEDIKFLVINEKGFIQCCYYSLILKEFQIPCTYWMPLPSAPKEEK